MSCDSLMNNPFSKAYWISLHCKHNLLAVKGKNKPQKVNAIMDHLRSFAESTKTNKQCSLSVEEVDDHDECEVDEGDEALPTCSSDEDFVLGEIGESSDQSDS